MFFKCNSCTFDIRTFQILSPKMDMTTFDGAVKYALERVGRPGMVLMLEQVEAICCMYAGEDVFVFTVTCCE